MITTEITLGNLLGFLATLVSIIIAWWATMSRIGAMHAENERRLGAMEAKIDAMWEWFMRQRGDYGG